MNSYYQKEETILTPADTKIEIDVYLDDTEYLFEPNKRYGAELATYEFTCRPFTSDENNKVLERIEYAKTQILMNLSPYSDKQPINQAIGRSGEFIFNQLFAPIVSGHDIEPWSLIYRTATIKCHLREDPKGLIYLQADYINVHDRQEQIGSASDFVDEDDF